MILLQGCWLPNLPGNNQPAATPEMPDISGLLDATQPELEPTLSPGQFTLRYDPDSTMNPITALNRDNIVLGSLLYESLFVLDEFLIAEPLLVESWHTYDYVTFTLEILPDVMMHDGAVMTADDVAYSLRQARNHSQSRHRNKLRNIYNITTDGDTTVTIILNSPNARFTRLLDIPIIRSGTIESNRPPGSGPFVFTSEERIVDIITHEEELYYYYYDEYETPYIADDDLHDILHYYNQPYEDQVTETIITETVTMLIRFIEYRHFARLPITSIDLLQFDDGEITELFDNGDLSLLWDDPLGAFDIRISRLHEPRLFHTTALQYLGFNANSRVLNNPDVRRAIGLAIDRQYIVDNILSSPRPGQAVAAPVAINPIFDMYDPSWEIGGDPLGEMGALLDRAGLYDVTNELFLQMPDGAGGFFSFTLEFIVNIENTHRVETAHWIANNLTLFGIRVNVRELAWPVFVERLQSGNFDLYLGETMLGADFDLSPLLLPGVGYLNFGNTANNMYRPLIDNFLAARTQEEVREAGMELNLAIAQNAPFVPIIFKRHAVYTHMGSIIVATPSQSGVFHNFHNWEIDELMLN